MMETRMRKVQVFGLILILVVLPLGWAINPVAAQENIVAYSPDGKGYLMEMAPEKYVMRVSGTPYEMGFQQGYLDPVSVVRLASDDWFINIVTSLLGADDAILTWVMSNIMDYGRLAEVCSLVDDGVLQQVKAESGDDLNTLLYKMLDLCQVLVALNEQYVPQAFIEEMHGVTDGVNAAGYSITYEYVRMLNMGMDALLALAYPVVEPLLFWLDLFSFLSCSGFVAQGDATVDGRTIMGRHWQFSSYVTSDHMLLMEVIPDSGNAFVSTTCAGFVGVTSAMNMQGLGIGNDMVPARDCDPDQFGMGTLLTARYVMQYCNQLTEAISFISSSVRGCSWIYGIGDGRNGETGGCALETSNSYCYVRDMEYEHPWWAFLSHPTIEKKDDLVTYTNHYIYRTMNNKADSTAIDDSKDRYSWLTNLALDMYGTLTLSTGATLIDYLHPPNYGYYDDPNGRVGCAVTCWDLTNLDVTALFGNYNDPWLTMYY